MYLVLSALTSSPVSVVAATEASAGSFYVQISSAFVLKSRPFRVRIMVKQDSQCTYDVTLRCVCATIVVVEKQCVFVALGTQHAMRTRHSLQWPAPLCSIFPHYLINGTIFEKKLLNTKCGP